MNKLFATIALAALALTGCIKENNTYKEMEPVRPGMSIYSLTMNQNIVSLEQANLGIRLAMLLAEARKQNPGADLSEVKLDEVEYEKRRVQATLFSSQTQIERLVDGNYKITFDKTLQMSNGFYLEGSMLVKTNGEDDLSQTNYATRWTIEMTDVKIYVADNLSSTETINVIGGTTILYATGDAEGSITIQPIGMRTRFGDSSIESNWGGEFTLKAEDSSLAYSLCAGKYFDFVGEASGTSMYTYDTTQPLSLAYELTDGIYKGMLIRSGTQECRLTNYLEYDTTVYPSSTVRYVWTLDDETSGTSSYKIYYNGHVFPKE